MRFFLYSNWHFLPPASCCKSLIHPLWTRWISSDHSVYTMNSKAHSCVLSTKWTILSPFTKEYCVQGTYSSMDSKAALEDMGPTNFPNRCRNVIWASTSNITPLKKIHCKDIGILLLYLPTKEIKHCPNLENFLLVDHQESSDSSSRHAVWILFRNFRI